MDIIVCIIVHTKHNTFLFSPFSIDMATKHTFAFSWDTFGIGVSTVCMIHCLAIPVLFSVLPLWSFLPVLHGWVHPVFMLTLLPVIYFAAKKSHYDRVITGLLTGGFLIVAAGWVGGHHLFGHEFETVATIAGSLVLVAGHWRNYRHHQTCSNPNHHHHEHHHEHAHHDHEHHHEHEHHHGLHHHKQDHPNMNEPK